VNRVLLALTLVVAAAPALAQDYRSPIITPASGTAPYVTAYRDDDSSGAKKDFTCGSHTYNGHGGTDIGIGGFGVMDAGSRDVVAAADGTVSAVQDGCSDRCTSGSCGCGGGFGNYVRIDHADGKRTYYAHLKTNSLRVQNGQRVTCGTVLGKVGSSGNSTGPHLHFEVRFSNNASDDPFAGSCGGPTSYWVSQGAYRALPSSTCEGGAAPPPPAPTTGTLRGVVFEDKGTGTADMSTRLAGATVAVVSPAMSTTAAGADAEWSFDVATGPRTVRVSAPGYVTAERTCDVAGDETWCSVGLVRVPAPEPEPEPEQEPEPEPEPAEGEGEGEGEGEAFPGDDKPEDPGLPGDEGTVDSEGAPQAGGPLEAPIVTADSCAQTSSTPALALLPVLGLALRRRRR